MTSGNMTPRNGLPTHEVLRAALDHSGYAVIPSLVDGRACAALASMYDGAAERFRSTVTMARHGFGRGEYKYLARPLPDLVQNLRETLYPPLSVIAIERVARRLQTEEVAAGVEIIREGDRGDQFYLVEAGELEVSHGATGVRRLKAGDHFGEIALLRGTTRSATVRTVTPSRLLRLESGDFLAAVTQHATSSDRLESVVAARLDASAEIKKGQSPGRP